MVTEKSKANLKKGIPINERSKDEPRKLGRKGGIASGESRRRKKTLKECAILFGELGVDEKTAQTLQNQGVKSDDMTHNMAVIYGLFASAMRGNSNAGRVLLELSGDLKQAQTNINVNNNVNPYSELSVEELRKLASEDE